MCLVESSGGAACTRRAQKGARCFARFVVAALASVSFRLCVRPPVAAFSSHPLYNDKKRKTKKKKKSPPPANDEKRETKRLFSHKKERFDLSFFDFLFLYRVEKERERGGGERDGEAQAFFSSSLLFFLSFGSHS